MTWIKGIAGFLAGFALGMAIMGYGLRKIPKDRLLKDSNLKFAGSAIIWALAIAGAWLASTFH